MQRRTVTTTTATPTGAPPGASATLEPSAGADASSRPQPVVGGGAPDQSGVPLRVALLGCGTVGSEVARLLTEQAVDLRARVGRPLELVGIAVRRPNRSRADLDPALFTTDAEALVARDDVDLVIEVIGGIEPARTLILTALEHGASVVTANKALLAEDGARLFAAAEQAGVDLYF
jgi:homoserine dehydrogenase